MSEIKRGTVQPMPQEKEPNNSILPSNTSAVKAVPQGWRLRTWETPRTVNQSIARVKNHFRQWGRMTAETAYLAGKEFIWLKAKVGHGNFQRAVEETGIGKRTAENLMTHARECDQVNRTLPYHPNPKSKIFIESPEEKLKKEKQEKPSHEWNATEGAQSLLERFESLTAGRTPEESDEVRVAFDEMAREFIEEKAESIRMIRGEGDKQLADERL